MHHCSLQCANVYVFVSAVATVRGFHSVLEKEKEHGGFLNCTAQFWWKKKAWTLSSYHIISEWYEITCIANLTSCINFASLETWYTSHLLSSMLNQPFPTSSKLLRMAVLNVLSQPSRRNICTCKVVSIHCVNLNNQLFSVSMDHFHKWRRILLFLGIYVNDTY